MQTLIYIFIILFIVGAVISPIAFFQIRKIFREQKNYERGLKMVPLLIHLPPISEDAEVGNRDVRDVVDENISKSQILYNIIASTLQKSLKSKFYGQRHFGFEIVASKGFVHFYAAVPIVLVEIVKQAVVSAYPAARLEEVSEHNIFNPVGKISATAGGELTLKENFAYPIATYQDIKRDTMQSLLNALWTLDSEDGAGIQILMRPAYSQWRKTANALANKKRRGKEGKSGTDGLSWWAKNFLLAFVKTPDEKSGSQGGGDKPEISSLDQAIADSIDEKTRHPGYEVQIRVIASSNISQKAQAILKNIVATFSLFDAPGKNGFKFSPAKDIERFVTAYILRFFPPEQNRSILNSVELATLFHFPDQGNTPTSQLERQTSKQVDGPRNMSDEGLLLGYNIFRGVKKPIRLALSDRQRHIYIVGQTGTGKSMMLENLALQDMLTGGGFAFIDPHGDVAERLLSMVPRERTEDVIYFCPADMEYPMGLNMFQFDSPEQKDFLIQEAINMLYKLYDPQHQGIIGPRFERIFTNSALLLMSDPKGGTFVDIPKLLIDPDFMKEKLQYTKDQNVLDFWTKEWPNAQRSNEAGEVTSWVVSKFGAFLSNEMMRNIIGQVESSFDLRDIMDGKKILLVNLSKGKTGDLNSKLLGMIFVMKFQQAAMSRANVPEDQRNDFCLYVDEFQNFSTDSFATIMSEARKYHLNLVVANQFTTQLSEEIRDAVFGNMGTIISFRVGQNDVDMLSKYFHPSFDPDDLLRTPNYNTITRTLVGGVPTQSFSMATLPPLGKPNPRLAQALKQLTAAKYGRIKSKVEAEINTRLATKTPPRPNYGASMGAPQTSLGSKYGFGGPGAAGMPTTPKTGKSFLDDWLAKKRQQTQTQSSNPAPLNTPAASSQFNQAVGSSYSNIGPTIPPAAPSASHVPAVAPGAEGGVLSSKPQHTADAINKQAPTDGEIKIARDTAVSQNVEDTIYIDKDGGLHNKSED